MRPALALAAVAALALASCSNPCTELGNRICNCQPPGVAQDNCKNQVKTALGSGPDKPSQADEAYCQGRLATCNDPSKDPGMCSRLLTYQGKVDCGIAYPRATAGLPPVDGGYTP